MLYQQENGLEMHECGKDKPKIKMRGYLVGPINY